ncbi:hypothetical protein D3C81_1247300 [compost metagenome]
MEGADHAFRHGGAADQHALDRRELQVVLAQVVQQPLPDGRHGRREGHALSLQQFIDGRAVHAGAGHDQLGARRRPAEGDAPGVDVEHGHHRQDDFLGRRAQDGRLQAQQGMDEVRAVRIEDALGIPRRARGVAKAAGGLLVEAAPLDVFRRLLQHGLVAFDHRQLGLRHVVGIGHHNHPLDRRTVRQDGVQQRHEGQIDKDDPVARVVDDIDQLLREQARVQGVAHRADAHDAVPGLDMVGGVPGQGGDTVTGLHAPGLQRVGHALGPSVNGAIGGAFDRPLDGSRHDLAVRVPVLGVIENLVDRQRPVLHRTQHRVPSSCTLCAWRFAATLSR